MPSSGLPHSTKGLTPVLRITARDTNQTAPARVVSHYFLALIENICGKLSLCFGSRHQPSSPRSITG